MQDQDLIEKAAKEAAEAAKEVLTGFFQKARIYEKGNSNNLVTEADIKAQEAIHRIIGSYFPEHKFYSEEGETRDSLEEKDLWIIDPLDGTNNYAHGIPFFCISIAYAHRGEVLYGCILDPNLNEFYSARKGGGAHLNGLPIKVSPRRSLSDSMIATGFYYDRGDRMRRTLDSIEALFYAGMRGIRRIGSAALDLCWVAAGRMEGFFEYKLSPWDFAAGMLIVREAGGTCTDTKGIPLSLISQDIAASNSIIHEELLDILKKVPTRPRNYSGPAG